MGRLRSVLFDIWFFLWTLGFLPVVLVLWVTNAPGVRVRAVSRVWVRGAIAGLRHIVGITYRETGRGTVPAGPCLFVANHQSPWETLVSVVLWPNLAIVAKHELGRIPLVGWCIRASPMILIDRDGGGTALRKMVADARAALEEGRSVLIFPEGTRRSVAAPIEFHRGFELLYRALGVPAVPIALNSGRCWGPDLRFRRAGVVTVSYLPAIEAGLPAQDMSTRVWDAIAAERDRLAGA